jgi:hypothetical protein
MCSGLSAQQNTCNPADDILWATRRGQQLVDRMAECHAGRAPHPPRSQPRHLDAGAHVCQTPPVDVPQHSVALSQDLPALALPAPATAEAVAAFSSQEVSGGSQAISAKASDVDFPTYYKVAAPFIFDIDHDLATQCSCTSSTCILTLVRTTHKLLKHTLHSVFAHAGQPAGQGQRGRSGAAGGRAATKAPAAGQQDALRHPCQRADAAAHAPLPAGLLAQPRLQCMTLAAAQGRWHKAESKHA